jgi:Mn-dependent DtxR family transcriptional regulator
MGRLIAAERPSVSNALARLARAGLVTGHGDEWHLHGDLEAHLNAMLEPGSGELEPVAGPIV